MGLTGAIGGGKSTALAVFAGLGAVTCDADDICHALYEDASVAEQLSARWGDIGGADGGVDREKIARIVFGDSTELEFLTGILYPALEVRLKAFREASQKDKRLFVAEIPLLFESGFHRCCDVTAALWTGAEIRHNRLRARGLSDAETVRREARQWSEDQKLETADFGILNCGGRDFLEMQCKRLLESLGVKK